MKKIQCLACGCEKVTLTTQSVKGKPDAIVATCPCGATAEVSAWVKCKKVA